MKALPDGFQVAGGRAGIKRSEGTLDLALIVTDTPVAAAGVYTQNDIVAAPVVWDQQRTPGQVRAVVANSGNANACTGAQGDADCARMAALTAESIHAGTDEVLVLSTGIIGETLPMERLEAALPPLAYTLGTSERSVEDAARALMTTDTHPKIARLDVPDSAATVTGIAKGAAMIAPNLATMLAVIMTDAALTPDDAHALLQTVVEDSFNAIRVDGHASTNDTVLLLASGVHAADRDALTGAIRDVACTLARMIPADGEGASHLITIDVTGARDRAEARRVAHAIADSPLVKTAVHGADPNWGRIISAAGMAGAQLDARRLVLDVLGVCVYDGAPRAIDAAALSAAMRSADNVTLALDLGRGTASDRCWSSDLTAEYVRLNAEYHT